MSKVTVKANWSLLSTAYATLFCLGLLDNARGPFFADIMRDLHLTNFQGSLFYATASFMAYFTGDRVAQWSKRWGTLVVVRSGQILMAVGFAAIALAQNLPTLLIFCAAFGFGFGILNVAQNLLVLEGALGPWRRRFFSGLHGMYAFASLLAPLICAAIFRSGRDWRFGFVIFAGLVSISIIVSLFAKNHRHVEVVAPVAHDGSLWNKYFWLVILISFYSLSELALTTRLSLYLIRERGFTAENAANWLAYFFIGMLSGRVILLVKHIHWPTRHIVSVCLFLTSLSFALGLIVNPIFLVVCGVFIGPIFGLCLDYIAEIFKDSEREAVSYCIAKSCLFIVTMHMVTGLLSDVIGLQKALGFTPIYLLIALFALYKTSHSLAGVKNKSDVKVLT
jgi:MFS transporter, FHS family, glucose/mannose:H+ symporter